MSSQTAPSLLEPLKLPLFRALWLASLVSNLGSWLQQIAGGWLMTSLRPDPFTVSLIEVANTLPMALLALPAGALADMFDRRRYLLATQSLMLLASGATAVLTLMDLMTPSLLLTCNFVLGAGMALNSPGWFSLIPEVVPRSILPSAIALNGLAINVARTAGPAMAGLILLWFGPGAAFALNSFSFIGVLFVLLSWKRVPVKATAPPEGFFTALRMGLRHARNSAPMRTVLLRCWLLLLCSSSLWALLPLLCREQWGYGSGGFGLMTACFGAGAVLAAAMLERLRARFSLNGVVSAAWLILATVLVWLSKLEGGWLPGLAMTFGGAGWLLLLSGFHLVVQTSAPGWVRGRAMAVYLFCSFAAACLGSGLWGMVAVDFGLGLTLGLAGMLLAVSGFTCLTHPMVSGEHQDLTPSGAWPHPEVALEPPPQHGPVVVTVEYVIAPADAPAFRVAAERLRQFRYQNGVTQWGIFLDIENPTLYREVYLEETWEAHLRHHERVTSHETEVAAKVYAFHRGEGMPPVTHHVHCDRSFPARPADPAEPPVYADTMGGSPLWFVDA